MDEHDDPKISEWEDQVFEAVVESSWIQGIVSLNFDQEKFENYLTLN